MTTTWVRLPATQAVLDAYEAKRLGYPSVASYQAAAVEIERIGFCDCGASLAQCVECGVKGDEPHIRCEVSEGWMTVTECRCDREPEDYIVDDDPTDDKPGMHLAVTR